MNSPNRSIVVSEMRKAAFWVGLRQEVTAAFASHRPIKISLDHSFIDQSFADTNDDAWANRIIIHCANVIDFCFGDADQKAGRYRALKEYDNGWLLARPPSFLPLAYIRPDPKRGEVFPRIHYISHAVGKSLHWPGCHAVSLIQNCGLVIGIVHAALARALLMSYDPTLPKLGPARYAAQQNLEEDIQGEIRELCGIALSNRSTIPALFTASIGVSSFGDRFSSDTERKALLDVLITTEAEASWPTAQAQINLKKSWGWL